MLFSSLQKELQDQDAKKERVENQLNKLIKTLRSGKKAKGELPEEQDIDLREMRDFNISIMKQIGEVVHHHPDIAAAVNLYFSQAGLPMPPTPGPADTSRPGSSRSSLASFRLVAITFFH